MPEQERARDRRRNPSKRLRFEIFKRDNFTCQYCGAQPPSVVLVCDHIDPVALGGRTSQENLITACESCNQGKGAIPLERVTIRPDADLMYLETQQEIAELKRYQSAVNERDELLREISESLQDRWQDITGLDWVPQDHVFMQMLHMYSAELVGDAVVIVAKKVADGDPGQHKSRWLPYMWGVLKTLESRLEKNEDKNNG